MALDKNRMVYFAGKIMSVQEFIESYGLTEESESTVEIIIEKLVKKGKLRYVETGTKEDDAFEKVAKELDLEARIAELEAEAERAESYALQKKREGKLMYEVVEIDFPSRQLALEFFDFCNAKLKLDVEVNQVGDKFVLTVYKVTEQDLSAIKRRKNFAQAGDVVFKTVDKVAESAVSATAFATEKVVVPTAKATLKTAIGLTKSLVKTGAQVGSTLISSTTKGTRQMAQELAQDEDVLRAKKDLIDAKDAVMRLFKRNGKSTPDIRIKH